MCGCLGDLANVVGRHTGRRAIAQGGTGTPEGLLAVPLVPTQQAVGTLASIVVGLLQAHLGILDVGEGYAKD